MPTTTYSKLRAILPESETHWRQIAARAHRLRKFPGDEAAAKTHELVIHEVRHLQSMGTPEKCACARDAKRSARVLP